MEDHRQTLTPPAGCALRRRSSRRGPVRALLRLGRRRAAPDRRPRSARWPSRLARHRPAWRAPLRTLPARRSAALPLPGGPEPEPEPGEERTRRALRTSPRSPPRRPRRPASLPPRWRQGSIASARGRAGSGGPPWGPGCAFACGLQDPCANCPDWGASGPTFAASRACPLDPGPLSGGRSCEHGS